MTHPGGLYIHIPFCRQKCRYCDFTSYAGQESYIDAYLKALSVEAAHYDSSRFDTLYIGGGTPSLLSVDQLGKLCRIINKHFGPVANFAESTFEANPESLSEDKLYFLKQQGLKRLSLGLQSFQDDTLKRIGRIHTVEMFLQAYKRARKVGFDNINVDLIAGLPAQSAEQFFKGIKQLVMLGPEHISVYGLQIEPGTAFAREGVQTDEDLLRQELEQTHVFLQEAGYTHYEISNFARCGFESQHNINYWQNGNYLGLGVAAASYEEGVRRSNTPDLQMYIARTSTGERPTDFSEKLTGRARAGERILLGLRMLEGVRLSTSDQRLFKAEIDDICARGLVEQKADLLKLTEQGLFLANQAFMAFVEPFNDK